MHNFDGPEERLCVQPAANACSTNLPRDEQALHVLDCISGHVVWRPKNKFLGPAGDDQVRLMVLLSCLVQAGLLN